MYNNVFIEYIIDFFLKNELENEPMFLYQLSLPVNFYMEFVPKYLHHGNSIEIKTIKNNRCTAGTKKDKTRGLFCKKKPMVFTCILGEKNPIKPIFGPPHSME